MEQDQFALSEMQYAFSGVFSVNVIPNNREVVIKEIMSNKKLINTVGEMYRVTSVS